MRKFVEGITALGRVGLPIDSIKLTKLTMA
jgi:hypothetical protein